MKKIDNFKSGLVFNLNFIIIASIYYNVILKLENNIISFVKTYIMLVIQKSLKAIFKIKYSNDRKK